MERWDDPFKQPIKKQGTHHIYSWTLQRRTETNTVLQLWWMGTQMEKLPNHRKRGLEEFEQGQTSSNRKHSGPKSNPKVTVGKNGILEGGREYYNPDPLY